MSEAGPRLRENASEVKKDMEKLKGQLIDALNSKGEAILNGNSLIGQLGPVHEPTCTYSVKP